jgi:hypothetical protein
MSAGIVFVNPSKKDRFRRVLVPTRTYMKNGTIEKLNQDFCGHGT